MPEQTIHERRFAPRLLITLCMVLLAAAASAWLIFRSSTVECDSLAPLTVLATLAAFLISVCFRQMARYSTRRTRWFLAVCLLVAGATLFTDFRFVRRYRGFCDEIRHEISPTAPANQ